MDCSLPGSSIHGIFEARVLEWGAIVFSSPTAWEILIPQPGIEPESPALEDGLLTTGPPGKSQGSFSKLSKE